MEERAERRKMQELREQEKRQEEERERMQEKKQVDSSEDVSGCIPWDEVLRLCDASFCRKRRRSGLKRNKSNERRRST